MGVFSINIDIFGIVLFIMICFFVGKAVYQNGYNNGFDRYDSILHKFLEDQKKLNSTIEKGEDVLKEENNVK